MKLSSSLVALCFLLSSCSKDSIKNASVEAISTAASSAIAVTLECKHPELIKERLKQELEKLEVFKPKPAPLGAITLDEKSVGSSVCVAAVSVVLPVILGSALSQVPAEWGCSGNAAQVTIKELAQKACVLIP